MAEQKPPSLFAQRPLRRKRVVFMMIGSFAVHGAIIGLAALRPVSSSVDAPIPLTEVSLEPPPVQIKIAPLEPPNAVPEPTPPMPENTPSPDETPPPEAETEMALPDAKPTPPPKLRPKAAPKVYLKDVKRGPVPQAGVPNGVQHADRTAGPVGGSGVAGKWSTPKPPYPYQTRASHVQGNGSVRVTTDGSGHVVNAVIVQSTGNGILDSATVSFARDIWKGPPSSSTTVQITYKLQ